MLPVKNQLYNGVGCGVIGWPLKEGVETDWVIELMRGVAALMVVITHYHDLMGWHEPGLRFFSTGVDLFFVISGFVFAPYLFGKEVRVRPFLIRRLFRVYPLYLFAIGLYATLKPWEPSSLENVAKHLFFLHTLESREVAFSLNPAFWSLPPEVEYYLALPVLALFSVRTWCGLLGFLFGALWLHFLISLPGYPIDLAEFISGLRYHLPGLLIEFMLGGLAWRVSGLALSGKLRWILVLTGVGIYICLGVSFARVEGLMLTGEINQKPWLAVHLGLFASSAFALIISSISRGVCQPSKLVKFIAIWLGNLSYGIYLFHNAFPAILDGTVMRQGSFVFGFVSFFFTITFSVICHVVIESPMRDYGRKLASQV